jgi:adenylosuccinate lyase
MFLNWSADRKFRIWRRVRIELAESERVLCLPISEEQTDEVKQQIDRMDYEIATESGGKSDTTL